MNVSSGHYYHPTPWGTQFEALTLPEMFRRAMLSRADSPLLHFLGRDYSYNELYIDAQLFASALTERGIVKGDRVGLFLPNVPTYVAAYYGAMMAGAVAVNFSPLYTAHELAHQVADSGTRLLVTVDVPQLYQTARQVLAESELESLVICELAAMLPWHRRIAMKLFARGQIAKVEYGSDVLRWGDLLGAAGEAPKRALDPSDIALLQYTGGTTGTPKGAMLSHANLTINAQQVAALNPFGDPEGEVFMGALPFFHVFANTALLNHAVVSGASIAMVPRFEARQVQTTIGRQHATGFPGVPTMFQALLDHPSFSPADYSSLKVCISGGAPLSAPLREKWEERTGVRLVEGYGLTESSGVVSANPYEGKRKPGTIGQVVAGTEVLLLDKADPARLAPAGEPGELAVHGPQIMQGYWKRPEATQEVFIERDGKLWLRTGDVAVIDDEGFIQIVDRIKDMIAVGGFKVFPSEVEKVLLQHPAIKEALVLGLPDDYTGEKPHAFVTLLGGVAMDSDEILSWTNERLGKHERLASVTQRKSLPQTLIGKLDRKALKAEVLGTQ
ncbi:MAG: long-chain fatty acid--CoA ligase [Alphaproteobacteria bacterium]|nr:MAG: long-chain fatty acid--CoA ligase [Alphaproteobacteria bacterium]